MQYLISDAEPELINNLTTDERNYQLDFIHFIRDIGYSLWSDNKLNLKTRKKIKKTGEEIIYKLKNQINKYADDKKTMKVKINEAIDKLKKNYTNTCKN